MSKKSTKLDWFDIFVCLLFADMLSAGLVNLNILLLISGIAGYTLYERIRKGQIDA
jgi:hypothetical protein